MRPASGLNRGMSRGRVYDGSIMDIHELWDLEHLREVGGIVDYTVGPPGVEVFLLAEHHDPKQRHYLELYKSARSALSILDPVHLVHFEVPNAIARVALFGDSVARRWPARRRGLRRREEGSLVGETLDEYGMYATYGEAVDSDEMSAGRYFPRGSWTAAGCFGRSARTPSHVRRCRAPNRAHRRRPACGAVPTLPQRNVARGAALGREPLARVSGHSTTALCSDEERGGASGIPTRHEGRHLLRRLGVAHGSDVDARPEAHDHRRRPSDLGNS